MMNAYNLKKYLIIFVLMLGISLAKSQTITTEANSGVSCTGEITVPILASNIDNISAISLTLDYDSALLSWDSFQNEQSELSTGFLIVNSNGTQVIISWFSLVPVNFGNDTLLELKFSASNPGVSGLIWNQSVPDNCMYTNANHNTVNSIFKDGTATIEDCSDIYGNVYYGNLSKTAMNNTSINLQNISGDHVDATISDANGDFIFDTLVSGQYTFESTTTKAWGGVNSTDALGIMRHFVQFDTIYGIRLAAADVLASGFVNTLDALACAQRFTLTINSFPSGDWLFWSDTVTLNPGKDTTTVITAICFGDIDGSYLPPFAKLSSNIRLNSSNSISVTANKEFNVPIIIDQEMEVGAISLVLNYPEKDIEILDVELKEEDGDESLIYLVNNGEIRIAWFDVDPIHTVSGEAIINLKCLMKNTPSTEVIFAVGVQSEFADAEANVIESVTIDIPKIISGSEALSKLIFYSPYPNPSNDILNVEYKLSEEAVLSIGLYDAMGRKLWEEDHIKADGLHKHQFDVSQYNSGLYYLKMFVDGQTKDFTRTKTVIVGD